MLAAEVSALLQNGLHPAVVLHVPVDARLPHQDCTATPSWLSGLHKQVSRVLCYAQQKGTQHSLLNTAYTWSDGQHEPFDEISRPPMLALCCCASLL